jgi:hypothetical protein
LGVGVDAGLGVIDEVPAGVIGIVVNDEIVTGAIPTPAGCEVPIPRSDFKRKTAGEPKAVRAEIEAVDVIAIGRAEMFEAAVRIGMRNDVTLVVGTIVAIPVILVDVRDTVDTSAGAAIDFGLGTDIAMCGSFGNAAVVGVHVVVTFGSGMAAGGVFAWALRLRGRADRHDSNKYQCWCQSYGNSETNPHRPASSLNF